MKNCGKNKAMNIAIIIIMTYIFITMFYMDLQTTIRDSYTWVLSAFDGKFASFYNNSMASYDVGMYITFGIWGIPVWILHSLVALDIWSIGSYIWFKLLLVICYVLTIRSICRVAHRINIYNDELYYQSLSMMIFVVPVIAVAQYDIIPMLCALLGIEMGLDGVNYKSTLLFAISFIMKPFTVFIFAIFILCKEKNVLNIIKHVLVSIVPFAVCKLIYALNRDNIASNNSFVNSKFGKLIDISFEDGYDRISVFFLALFLSLIVAYCTRKNVDKMMIILCSSIWLAFCIFTPAYPYWVVYLCPFLILTMGCINGENTFIAHILELITELILFVVFTISYPWVFGGADTMAYLIFKNIHSGKSSVATVYNIMCRVDINRFAPVFHAALLATSVSLIVIAIHSVLTNQEKMEIWKGFNYIRMAIMYLWVILCTALLFVAS